MTVWDLRIHTIATAQTPGPEVLFQRGFGEWINIAIHCFELRSSLGTFLVDTGFSGPVDALNAAMRARKGNRAGFNLLIPDIWAVLENDLLGVAVTSFGPYAVGGLTGLKQGIPVYASSRGLRDLRVREELYLHHPIPKTVAAVLEERAKGIEGSGDLAPGLRFHEVGIHHPASAAIEVSTKDGPLIIADPVFCARNLVDRVALGAAENAAEWYHMVRRLARDDACFLPIHDADPQPVRVVVSKDGAWTAQIGLEMTHE